MILSSRNRILAVIVLLMAVSVAGAADLTPHRAEYKVKISVVSGQLNTELQAVDTGFIANHAIKPVGMSRILTNGRMKVSSVFSASAQGVRPVKFHEVDTIKDEPEVRLSFDWTTNTASGTA